MKTQAQMLYGMAAALRRRGYSPTFSACGRTCFLGIEMSMRGGSVTSSPLLDVIGTAWFRTEQLIAAGWTEGCTDDAATACEIAGDIAFEQERGR